MAWEVLDNWIGSNELDHWIASCRDPAMLAGFLSCLLFSTQVVLAANIWPSRCFPETALDLSRVHLVICLVFGANVADFLKYSCVGVFFTSWFQGCGHDCQKNKLNISWMFYVLPIFFKYFFEFSKIHFLGLVFTSWCLFCARVCSPLPSSSPWNSLCHGTYPPFYLIVSWYPPL